MNGYDEASAFLGHWGCFQKIVFFLLCVSTIPNGTGLLAIVFVADIPSHHCVVPEVNITQDWLSGIIPIKVVDGKQQLSRCSRYRLDVVRNLSAQGLIPGRDVNLTDLEQEGCVDGWSYSKDIYQSTIVSEFDLVCSDQWKQPFTTTVYFLGVLVGTFVSGQLSDRYGRKPVFFAAMAVQTIFTFAQIFSPSWTVFSILFFFSGFGQTANYIAAFVLGDLDWQYTGPLNTMPVSVFCLWLYDAATLCLFFKGLEISAAGYLCAWLALHPLLVVDERKTCSEKRLTVFDLIRTSNIRATTLILSLGWFTFNAGYFALSLNTSQLSADPYISCFISAAVEVPAYIASWLALQYFPRRLCVTFPMVLGGVSLFFIQLVPQTLPEMSVALEMLGKSCFAAYSAMIFVYTTELYPTMLRNTAMGICSMFSRMGSCIAPFLLQLSAYFKYLPYITLATLAVVSALTTLLLPESFGRPLPETLQQMHTRERMKCPCITQKETPDPVVLLESQL